MMAAEFHGLDLSCSPSSVIPQGIDYKDISYQSCAISGSIPGSLIVNGDSYIAETFGYYYSNIWRDFGIMLIFTIAFILLATLFSEALEWHQEGGGALQFKNTKRQLSKAEDEENSYAVDSKGHAPQLSSGSSDILMTLETSKSTFTWKNLTYTVPYDGSTKILLNNISGYAAPGQMTALVGASGAGKTTCEFSSMFKSANTNGYSIEHACATSTYW